MAESHLQQWRLNLDELHEELKSKILPGVKVQEFVKSATDYQHYKSQCDQAKKQLERKGKQGEPPESQASLKEEVDNKEKAETLEGETCQALLGSLLSSGELATKLSQNEMSLMKCAILSQMLRPRTGAEKRLVEFCNNNPTEHPKLIHDLLNDPSLMKQMLANGGPTNANWGPAMKIYQALLPLIKHDEFQNQHKKLALAVALEHATPMPEFDTPDIMIDPIERFKHFAEAHRKGELDPAFCHFSTWEYRMVVDCNSTNEQMQWGRNALKRFRPNQVRMDNTKWRYAISVKTDLGYRQPTWTSETKTYQQMMSGGGKCGPRAWYGRFICNAHGIPTWGVRQPGHAAVGRWTSTAEGWVTILGAGWHKSFWEGRKGIDFRNEAHARSYCRNGNKDESGDDDKFFYSVTLVECMAEVMDECSNLEAEKHDIAHPKHLWRSLRGYQIRSLKNLADEKSFKLPEGKGLVDTQFEQDKRRTDNPEDDNVVEVLDQGVVKIPACAFNPRWSRAINPCRTFDSEGGGGQVLMTNNKSLLRYLLPDTVKEGEYELKFKVCNVHEQQQPLHISVDKGEGQPLQIPYTVGEWAMTGSIKVTLGLKPALTITRGGDHCFGLTIKEMYLTPCPM